MIQRDSSGSQLKNRVDWVDVAKGLGIICVVLGHLPMSGQKSNMALMHHVLYLFHMPLFLILSGYTFRAKSNGECVKNRVDAIIVPYFAFMVLVMVVDYLWSQINGLEPFVDFSNPVEMLARPILGGGALYTPLTAYWYLTCFFFVVILYNFVENILGEKLPQAQGIVALSMLALGLAISRTVSLTRPFEAFFDLNPLGLMAVPTGYFFFWTGHSLKGMNLSPVQKLLIIMIGIVAAFYAAEMDLKKALTGNLFNPVTAIGLSLLVLSLSRLLNIIYPLKEGLTVLGRTSLSILALHMLFIKHLEFIGLPFLSATIAIGISVCFHYLMLPYPPLRTVFGGRR